MFDILDAMARNLARAMAALGGAVLIFVVLVACSSIIGRSLSGLGLSQIRGDFEIVELGVGFAVFAFLPWTQYMRANARVDLLEARFPLIVNKISDLVADLVVFAIALVLTWRLWLGMLDKKSYFETTFILQFPIWIAYLAGLVGLIVFSLVAFFCVLRSARNMRSHV